MTKVTTIGLDLAKRVFQVHGADGDGRPVLRKKLRRAKLLPFFADLPPCLVGIEACASAHHWARELQALGHEVRLIPPQYVRPFVKTNKNDAADAEAICEAVTRPTMRFAALSRAEQQSVLMLHRARELLVRQRTMVLNALRGHCAEFGIVVAQGAPKVEELIAIIEDADDPRLPSVAREALGALVEQLRTAQGRIKALEARLTAWHRSSEPSRRLATIPGVGVITAPALVATIGDASQFRSGRQLSAWLGLVPRQHSSEHQARYSDWASIQRIPCTPAVSVPQRKAGYMTASSTAVSSLYFPCKSGGVHTCCAGAGQNRGPVLAGPTGSWRGGRPMSSLSPWPIRRLASPGRYSGMSAFTNRCPLKQTKSGRRIARVTTI